MYIIASIVRDESAIILVYTHRANFIHLCYIQAKVLLTAWRLLFHLLTGYLMPSASTVQHATRPSRGGNAGTTAAAVARLVVDRLHARPLYSIYLFLFLRKRLLRQIVCLSSNRLCVDGALLALSLARSSRLPVMGGDGREGQRDSERR